MARKPEGTEMSVFEKLDAMRVEMVYVKKMLSPTSEAWEHADTIQSACRELQSCLDENTGNLPEQ